MSESEFQQNVAALAPIFTAPPGGDEFARPKGWQHTDRGGNDVRLKGWEPGQALCAVMGERVAVVDVDPRNKGDGEKVRQLLNGLNVQVFAEIATPGGGFHLYINGHPDLPKCSDLAGYPGVDVMSHGGQVFLPGTARPKYDGGGYKVIFDNLGALADGGDQDGAEAFADWVGRNRATSAREPFDPSPPWSGAPPDDGRARYLRAALTNQHEELSRCESGQRNDNLFTAALKLGNYVAGAGMDEDEVKRSLFDAANNNGLIADDGEASVRATIVSGLKAGKQRPRAVPESPPVTVLDVFTEAATSVEQEGGEAEPYAFVPGGTFILDTAPDPQPLWGSGSEVLLADGEALIIAGDQGLGKTTLGQQLALGRCGIGEYATLLGYPIKAGVDRTLYLAMDRPRQVARSWGRMVGQAWRAELDARLVVWPGPPPGDLAKFTGLLLDLCRKANADTVILDSLKDAALGLNDDETGAGYNRARQTAIAAGVQVIELHHNRKTQQGAKNNPSINDVYGSTWITSGAGSVLLLTGSPGDLVVGLRHLKQPADEVGPLTIRHDHDAGKSHVHHGIDLLTIAQRPISAVEVAKALFETSHPTANEKAKARRKLEKGVKDGLLRVAEQGDPASNRATLWVAAGPVR